MSSLAYVNLCELQSREDLVDAWEICRVIADQFPGEPEDPHWFKVREAFKVRATELGIELKA